jgi:hypothetical protein
MQFQLTPSVNVKTEREKLRALRDEIAAEVAARKEHERKFTPRGYPWISRQELFDLRELAAKAVGRHGETPICEMRSGAGLDVSATAANVRETKAGRCGKSCAACGVECKGVGE